MSEKKQTTYDDLIAHNPKIADIIDKKVYDYTRKTNLHTVNKLGKLWVEQARKNCKNLDRFGLLNEHCRGMGHNKAVVMIGAGSSLKKNWKTLQRLCHWNAQFPFALQPFLFMVCNHQFKPCLEDGIIPHFVVLCDASPDLYDQLCKDIHKTGQNTVLFCSIHASPKIVKGWVKQGRTVQFYIPTGDEERKVIEEETGKDPDGYQMMQGGNVMNVAWMASLTALDSRVFMSLGYDLSYEIADSIEDRRVGYYADGDYSTNMASKRDEAKGIKLWVGYEMYRNSFTLEGTAKFKKMGTTGTLFNYKSWLETYLAIQDVSDQSFHYFNCSENGILGVVPKSYEVQDLENTDNWMLLDEVLPRRYHTMLFEDAADWFIRAWEVTTKWPEQRRKGNGAGSVIALPGMMDFARITGKPTKENFQSTVQR